MSFKRYNNIKGLDLSTKLEETSFANLFNIVEHGEKSYFNINKTIYFLNNQFIDQSSYFIYEIMPSDNWTGISYKFYETYKLWWLICKFNNIVNPFTELTVGKPIKILKKELVNNILTTIQA